MATRLALETSPYLLQHADNPVDWYPWGPEALAAARASDKPIFLSVGYSACHWCHVMAHESFSDPALAEILNREFVSIKVDREEHPELDQIYMEAVQRMAGHGGWPMSVFLTPDLEPFYGGTYWPPGPRGGMPGFGEVLAAVVDAWRNRRNDVVRQAKQMTELLRDRMPQDDGAGGGPLRPDILEAAAAVLRRAFDPDFGGFGPAPKFPQPLQLQFLLRRWVHTGEASLRDMATATLDKMAAGGMVDHLGGGFHRYSVDARWLVPHFEKMLYDNALLAGCYLEAWQATSRSEYARVVRETLDYVLRDMTEPDGGFASSEDADSEGGEGAFYVWTPGEVRAVLGPEAAEPFCYVYDVTEAGNFEGRNILNCPKTVPRCAQVLGREADALEAELADSRRKLLEARSRRARPGRDNKVLTGWNGLMIDALARAGAALGEPRYLEAAVRAARFLLQRLRRDDGRLWHCWREGRASVDGLLEDYASLAHALVTLHESQFDERWIDEAIGLAEALIAGFADREEGGFYTAGENHDSLLVRKKDMVDSSVPSGGGLAAAALLRLGRLCGRNDFLAVAEAALRASVPLMERLPLGAGQLLLVADSYLGSAPEIVLVSPDDDAASAEILAALHRLYRPGGVVAFRRDAQPRCHRSQALAGRFAGRTSARGEPSLYVCEDSTCRAPIRGTKAVLEALSHLSQGQRPAAPHGWVAGGH